MPDIDSPGPFLTPSALVQSGPEAVARYRYEHAASSKFQAQREMEVCCSLT